MPQLISDGPLGLEARHRFLAWPVGNIDYLMNPNRVLGVTGFLFDTMPDFGSLPDFDANSQSKTGRRGLKKLPSYSRGKTFSAEGFLVGTNAQDLRQERSALTRVFGYRNGLWRIEPHADYGITSHFWQADVTILELDIDEEYSKELNHVLGPYQLKCSITARMNEGVWLWNELQDTGPVEDDTFTVNNAGNAPAEPELILVHGVVAAGSSIVVENQTVEQSIGLDLSDEQAFSGGVFKINFNFRTITWYPTGDPGSEDDASGALNPQFSTWWWDIGQDIQPGDNDIFFSGATSCQVRFYHSHW